MNTRWFSRLWQYFQILMCKKFKIIVPAKLPGFAGSIFLTSSAVITYIYGMVEVIPALFESHLSLALMQIITTWIFIGFASNFYLVRQRSSSIRTRMLTQPVVEPVSSSNEMNTEHEVKEAAKHMGQHFTATPYDNPTNWHICAVCEVFVPPRTWHCHICNTCILRRDHHCIFTGSCIGEENQSNFMGLLFYVSVGTTLSTLLGLLYHLYVLERPFLSYIFRSVVLVYTLFYDLDFKYVISAISCVGHVVAWSVFAYYLYNALKGQTSADAHRNIYWTNGGCRIVSFENMKNFLGPNPIFRIVWPFHEPMKLVYGTNYRDIPSSMYKSEEEYRKELNPTPSPRRKYVSPECTLVDGFGSCHSYSPAYTGLMSEY